MDSPLDDPHLRATGFIGEEDHPTEGRIRTLGNPTTWSMTPSQTPSYAPRLGEHSAAVLRRAGYSEAQIKQMDDAGATRLG